MHHEIKFRVVGFTIVIIILQINAWMSQMAMSYPDLATVESIGLTWEGRETKMMKVLSTNVPAFALSPSSLAKDWRSTPLNPSVAKMLYRWSSIAVLEKQNTNFQTLQSTKIWRVFLRGGIFFMAKYLFIMIVKPFVISSVHIIVVNI